ncbi:MAG: ABC transporter substrate-binding protein, partial [Thermomicrobia bacterium]|nr:ABC transporter substrate-binding protein [Thermomicrobia bacterium]
MKRTNHFRRYAAMALLALIVPMLLAACGGSAATETPKAAATTITGAVTAAAPSVNAAATTVTGAVTAAAPTVNAAATSVAPTANAATGKSGGQLVIGVSFDDFITMDPGHYYEVNDSPVLAATYEPLVAQNPPDITKFVPVLATEVPTVQNGGVSADGKVYTFHLRDNVKFHTGNTMTADDWVFSMKRLHYLSDNPSFLAGPYSTKDAVNVTAVDKLTLKITLTDPNVAFLSYLATNNNVVMDSKAVMAKGGTDAPTAKDTDKAKDFLDQNSAGTGPYVLKSFKLKDELDLDKNASYWRAPAKLDHIIYKAIQTSGSQRQQLEAGAIDIAEGLDADAVAELQKGGTFTIVTGNTLNHTYLALNT